MDAAEQDTVRDILREFDVDAFLTYRDFEKLADTLSQRESVMISDALDTERRKVAKEKPLALGDTVDVFFFLGRMPQFRARITLIEKDSGYPYIVTNLANGLTYACLKEEVARVDN